MKKIMILLIFSINLFAGQYTISDSIFNNNGWAKPFNRTLKTSTYYDYESSTYFNNFKFWHGAVDIVASLNEKVYSIASGKVIKIYRKTTLLKNMSVLYIKYKTEKNKEFLVIYGHVYAKNSLKEGAIVEKGEYIGNIKRYGSPDHIHFGITTDLNYHGSRFGSSTNSGIVNPLTFLEENKNEMLPIIDGIGSVINPINKTSWGTHRDEADMQVHKYSPSAVLFQWNYKPAVKSCSYLNIGLLSSADYRKQHPNQFIDPTKSLDVKVYVKPWDSYIVTTAYKTKLPITIEAEDYWNTIAIVSQKPISSTQKIVAECAKFPYSNQNEKEMIHATQVKSLSNYVWAGNSSIIRKSNALYLSQVDGIYQDVAVTLSDNKALTYFQWEPSESCKSLKLQAGSYDTQNPYANINQVDIKAWSAKEWGGKQLCKELPCIIKAPSTSSYYLIKVKTEANAIQSGKISAVCQ